MLLETRWGRFQRLWNPRMRKFPLTCLILQCGFIHRVREDTPACAISSGWNTRPYLDCVKRLGQAEVEESPLKVTVSLG